MDAMSQFHDLYINRHKMATALHNQGKTVLGFFEIYTPEEIIYASNILPVRLLGGDGYPALADLHSKNYTCPYQRSILDQGLRGNYDYIDGFVAPKACDATTRFSLIWENHIKKPYIYFVNLPHKRSENAISFFRESLLRFKEALEKDFGEISESSLKHAIHVYNENRALLK